MKESSSLSGIITKSIALCALIPIFMFTTTFFGGGGIVTSDAAGTVSFANDESVYEAHDSSLQADEPLTASSHTGEAASVYTETDEATKGTYEDAIFSPEDWKLILVNKQHPIPENYEFPIGDINSYMQCDERIRKRLMKMLADAAAEEVYIFVASPYRSDDKQDEIFTDCMDSLMEDGLSYTEAFIETAREITIPGTSEHQIGLAVDIIIDYYTTLDAGFAETKAYEWLESNCADYGFIVRYPEGKEEITGISFEPWHFRYVGEEAAHIIMREGITLEEFWDQYIYR